MAKEGEHYYDDIYSEWSEILDVEYFQFFLGSYNFKRAGGICMHVDDDFFQRIKQEQSILSTS